ncbi:ribosome maturation factor RimP [Nisaea acidiphila]|uniref:Ribosome maturation factor RimP n=1 Tax=Nisaea acidiphila TaxID=1862145 RepID=A0A9J7AXW0_9PROT|nr:ribosome maturation factor RimP [Nisaea acidiphila]UUX52120.1 ribosome maturation factor RimP [Nisaea acidiphila]
MTQQLTERIAAMIGPSIESMGYDLVRVSFTGGKRAVLQIMAERTDRNQMTVDDCADISRAISLILDVEDPISGEYNLEVSSPGIDRPLVRPEDYNRFAGFEAKIELEVAVDGRKRFRGEVLGAADDGTVAIEQDGERLSFPFASVRTAKLVLTDALIDAAERGEI